MIRRLTTHEGPIDAAAGVFAAELEGVDLAAVRAAERAEDAAAQARRTATTLGERAVARTLGRCVVELPSSTDR